MSRHHGAPAIALGLWLSLAGCRCGAPEAERGAPRADVADQPLLLATLAAQAGEGEPEFFFAERGGGVAWADQAGGAFRVVHDGRPGRAYPAIGAIALSPDGARCAYGALVEGAWRMVVDGREGKGYAEVQSPVFSPDGAHLAYQARTGDAWRLVVDASESAPSATPFQGPEFSADSTRLAFIADADGQGVGRLVVTDVTFSSQRVVEPRATGLLASEERRSFAAIAEAGEKERLVVAAFGRPEAVRRGPLFDALSSPAIGPDGSAQAYLAERAGRQVVVLDDREEALPPGQVHGPVVIRPGGMGVGLLSHAGAGTRLLQFFAGGEPAGPAFEEAEGLCYSRDGRSHAYVARRGERWFAVVNGREGPPLDRVVSPSFSPDGRFVVYRARQDGRRFVVVADLQGTIVRRHAAYQQVFPFQFTRDGTSVAYGVKDGPRLRWVVEPL
jgi:hypothetical protein